MRSLTGAAYTYVGARGRAILRRDALSGEGVLTGGMCIYIGYRAHRTIGFDTVPFWSVARSFGSVGDRHIEDFCIPIITNNNNNNNIIIILCLMSNINPY